MHRTRFQRFSDWSRRALSKLLSGKSVPEKRYERIFHRMDEDGYLLRIREQGGRYSLFILGDKAMSFVCSSETEAKEAQDHYAKRFHEAALVNEKMQDGLMFYYLFRPLRMEAVLELSLRYDEILAVMTCTGEEPIAPIDMSSIPVSSAKQIKAQIDSM